MKTLLVSYLVLILAGIAGWIMNVVQVCSWAGEYTGMFVVKCIGIVVAPLGAVLGWIG
jgi:type III secretory pathway component EscS